MQDNYYKQLLKNAPVAFRINFCLFRHIIKLINFFIFFGLFLVYLLLGIIFLIDEKEMIARIVFYGSGFYFILAVITFWRCISSYYKSMKNLMEVEQNKNECGQELPANSIVFNVKEKWDD